MGSPHQIADQEPRFGVVLFQPPGSQVLQQVENESSDQGGLLENNWKGSRGEERRSDRGDEKDASFSHGACTEW